MQEKPKDGFGRRDFLRGLGAGAAGAATVTAAPLISSAQAAESDSDKKKARYQESPHVKKYYSVNRYPAKK